MHRYSTISINKISYYRAELMGIGILGVMISHLSDISDYSIPILSVIPKLVYTEGFLLLSGIGCFYSYVKAENQISFYRRRLQRVFYPYLFLTIPFLSFFYFYENKPFIVYLGELTSMSFWYEGNFYGMWYVSISLFAYLLFPFIYRGIFKGRELFTRKFIWILLSAISIPFVVRLIMPEYYKLVGIGISRFWMFIVGVAVGFFSWTGQQLTVKQFTTLFATSIALVVLLYFCKNDESIEVIYMSMERLIFIAFLCISFVALEKNTPPSGNQFQILLNGLESIP